MTSAFKAQVKNDIKMTFLNSLEFADWHDIDGARVLCMLDSDIIQERNARTQSDYAEGVFEENIVLYIQETDLPRRPVREEVMFVDGRRYFVTHVAENIGVLEVTLSEARA